MKLSNRMNKILATVTHLLLTLIILTVSVQAETLRPKTVLSFEGSYFNPRRTDFKELYGSRVKVVGARLDIPLKKKTSLSIKGRYFRMTEIDSLVFTNISLGLLLKRTFPENEITNFYLASGVQIEYRRVGFSTRDQQSGFGYIIKGRSFAQWGIAPSVAVEGGVDIWILNGLKISPNVGFHYFPYFLFGDPSIGNFGDTGGFMFSASLGFRL